MCSFFFFETVPFSFYELLSDESHGKLVPISVKLSDGESKFLDLMQDFFVYPVLDGTFDASVFMRPVEVNCFLAFSFLLSAVNCLLSLDLCLYVYAHA